MNHNHAFAVWQAEIISRLAQGLISKPIKILDFGAGDGMLTHFIQNTFFRGELSAVDTDEQKVKILTDYYPSIRAHHITHRFPCNDTHFDLIYAANTFHHIPKEMHDFWLQELFRVLKKDGTLIVLELNPFNLKTLYHFRHNPEEKNAQLINPYCFKKRLQQYGRPKLKFFFPNYNNAITSALPFGPLYSLLIKK